MMREKGKVLRKLFFSTLYLSTFTFGGGYVIVTLMKEKFVDQLHWIKEDEMLDLIAIAQSAPGAIAVNGAIVVGYKLAGLIGALVAIVATIIPPFVIISVISYFYELFRDNFIINRLLSGMQAGVGAVIASVVWDMGGSVVKQKDAASIVIMLAAFVAVCVRIYRKGTCADCAQGGVCTGHCSNKKTCAALKGVDKIAEDLGRGIK